MDVKYTPQLAREVERAMCTPLTMEQMDSEFVVIAREGNTFALISNKRDVVPAGTAQETIMRGRKVFLMDRANAFILSQGHRVSIMEGVLKGGPQLRQAEVTANRTGWLNNKHLQTR